MPDYWRLYYNKPNAFGVCRRGWWPARIVEGMFSFNKEYDVLSPNDFLIQCDRNIYDNLTQYSQHNQLSYYIINRHNNVECVDLDYRYMHRDIPEVIDPEVIDWNFEIPTLSHLDTVIDFFDKKFISNNSLYNSIRDRFKGDSFDLDADINATFDVFVNFQSKKGHINVYVLPDFRYPGSFQLQMSLLKKMLPCKLDEEVTLMLDEDAVRHVTIYDIYTGVPFFHSYIQKPLKNESSVKISDSIRQVSLALLTNDVFGCPNTISKIVSSPIGKQSTKLSLECEEIVTQSPIQYSKFPHPDSCIDFEEFKRKTDKLIDKGVLQKNEYFIDKGCKGEEHYVTLSQPRGKNDAKAKHYRGLVYEMNKKEICAYPFTGFSEIESYENREGEITVKLDGSYLILWTVKKDGKREWRCSTKRRMTSQQAKEGHQYFVKNCDPNMIPENYTILCEYMSDTNMVIVTHPFKEPILLGIINNIGCELPRTEQEKYAMDLNLKIVPLYYGTPENVLGYEYNKEGYVFRDEKGRHKIIHDTYTEMSQAVMDISPHNIWRRYGQQSYSEIEEWIDKRRMPLHLRDYYQTMKDELEYNEQVVAMSILKIVLDNQPVVDVNYPQYLIPYYFNKWSIILRLGEEFEDICSHTNDEFKRDIIDGFCIDCEGKIIIDIKLYEKVISFIEYRKIENIPYGILLMIRSLTYPYTTSLQPDLINNTIAKGWFIHEKYNVNYIPFTNYKITRSIVHYMTEENASWKNVSVHMTSIFALRGTCRFMRMHVPRWLFWMIPPVGVIKANNVYYDDIYGLPGSP